MWNSDVWGKGRGWLRDDAVASYVKILSQNFLVRNDGKPRKPLVTVDDLRSWYLWNVYESGVPTR